MLRYLHNIRLTALTAMGYCAARSLSRLRSYHLMIELLPVIAAGLSILYNGGKALQACYNFLSSLKKTLPT